MFDRLFGRVEREIDTLVWKYVRRAVVALPLLVAAIFATIVCSILAVERFGPIQGYGIMAGGFVVLAGLVALFAYAGSGPSRKSSVKSKVDETRSESEARSDGPGIPPEAISLLTAVVPVALPRLARSAVRNLPTLAILAIIAFVLSLYTGSSKPETESSAGDQPEDEFDEPEGATTAEAPQARPTTMGARGAVF